MGWYSAARVLGRTAALFGHRGKGEVWGDDVTAGVMECCCREEEAWACEAHPGFGLCASGWVRFAKRRRTLVRYVHWGTRENGHIPVDNRAVGGRSAGIAAQGFTDTVRFCVSEGRMEGCRKRGQQDMGSGGSC